MTMIPAATIPRIHQIALFLRCGGVGWYMGGCVDPVDIAFLSRFKASYALWPRIVSCEA
jgi:hypothetical protein